jgi:predicted amidophosphoribosyltransferase
MIPTLVFASCYVYSPCGRGRMCEQSRLLRSLLKQADPHFLAEYARRVRCEVNQGSIALRGFFDCKDVLVPVPGSTHEETEQEWVATHLALALINEGLGREVCPVLRRIGAVRKSAFAPAGARPSVDQHYESFAIKGSSTCRPGNMIPGRIMLIDDVVTKGRTLYAAAARLRESFPDTPIRAFALVRTSGLVGGVERLLEPCRGQIRFQCHDVHRHP